MIFNGSSNGFKHPQQLFKLYYLNFLGYEFDYIIDISGHHELVHPLTKNVKQNIPIDWPRGYFNDVLHFATDYTCLERTNNLKKLNTKIPILEILILKYISSCKKKIYKNNDNKYYIIEDYNNVGNEKIINDSIKIWQTSIEEMNKFVESKNKKFISVIMPNQYLELSKNFSDYEKSNLLNYKEYGEIIKDYYSKLNYASNTKVKYKLDLRQLFQTEKNDMYIDSCCRYSEEGIKKILNEIMKYIN